MTILLQQAFEAAAKFSAEEQDLLAARLLAELAAEDDFDRAIAAVAIGCRALGTLEGDLGSHVDYDQLLKQLESANHFGVLCSPSPE